MSKQKEVIYVNTKYVLIGVLAAALLVGAYAAAEGFGRGRMREEARGDMKQWRIGNESAYNGSCLGPEGVMGFGAGVGGGRLRDYVNKSDVLGGCACVLAANESAEAGYTANCACRLRANASVTLEEGGRLDGNIVSVGEGGLGKAGGRLARRLCRNRGA